MWPIATDRVVWSVGLWPKNYVLDGVQIPTQEWLIPRAKGVGPRHARTCPAVDVLNVTRQGAAPVWC